MIVGTMFSFKGIACLRNSFSNACRIVVQQESCFTGPDGLPRLEQIKKQFIDYGAGRITFKKDDLSGIATIGIDNQDKKNAISGKMMVELNDIVTELKSWTKGKAIVLHSHGANVFCSGGDLNTVRSILSSSSGKRMSKLMHSTMLDLLTLPLVSVAFVEGKAIGGGAELTTWCDFRLMGVSGQIQFVQGRMGVATGWGGGTRLVRLIGQTKALKLLVGCRKLTAQESVDIGLSEEIIDGGVDEAIDWTRNMVDSMPPEVLQTMKNIVTSAEKHFLEDTLEQERSLFSNLWAGKAHVDALNKNVKHN